MVAPDSIPLTRELLEKQLGGAFLQKFAFSICGVAANWQPSFPRARKTIEAKIKNVSNIVEFLQKRDPDLFRFLC